jgi:hypothetical protein
LFFKKWIGALGYILGDFSQTHLVTLVAGFTGIYWELAKNLATPSSSAKRRASLETHT